ncbi:MAG: acyltransferase [Leptolyngbyaceae cyanobacterium bins.349]|nr:acyltransferase [Leptolyngbyaceae cyanobacterium bins.349]
MVGTPSVSRFAVEKERHPSQKQPEARFEGFDFLRAVFSIAVVALKTNLFLLAELLVSSSFAYALIAKTAYLAVPVFLQISLFLFYLKSETLGFSYFLRKRLPRLISLYFFWVGMKVLFDISVKGQSDVIIKALSAPRSLIEFIVSGGQSPFFFFFALTFLTTLAAALISLFRRLRVSQSKRLLINYALLIASCLLIFVLSVVEIIVNRFGGDSASNLARSISNIAFWDYNPLNFLPYLFTTAIAIQEFNDGRLRTWSKWLKTKLSIILAFTICFSTLELHLFEKLLHYSRLSLVFGSWLLLYLALLSTVKVPASIKFIASCSLGIYGFHVFFDALLSAEQNGFLKNFFPEVPGLSVVVSFVLVLGFSILMTIILKQVKGLKNYV